MNFFSRYRNQITAFFVTVILVYLMIYLDVTLRARSAYLNGEKYWNWYQNPGLKQAELNKELDKNLTALEKQLAKGRIGKEEFERKRGIEKFNFDRKLEESAVKYAYVWYQTAVELFSPPDSKWVVMARRKMPVAREAWKEELRRKNIPFEDYMLE